MAKIRISLKHLLLLSTLIASDPSAKPIASHAQHDEEIDAVKIIPELVKKFTKLAQTAKDFLKKEERDDGYKTFETLMHESTKTLVEYQVISEESLIDSIFMDPSVLSRDDIKKQSDEIVQANLVSDDMMPDQKKRKTFS